MSGQYLMVARGTAQTIADLDRAADARRAATEAAARPFYSRQRNGGITFVRIGRFGFSYYITRKACDRPRVSRETENNLLICALVAAVVAFFRACV